MMSKCTDPGIGMLIHAYELDALTDLELERFEKHLLECDHCFGDLQDFSRAAAHYRGGDVTREIIRRTARPAPVASRARRLASYLWPDIPVVFRPGVLLVLVLLMVYPAYLGLRGPGAQVRQLQSIMLSPSRTAGETVSAERDVDLYFLVEGVLAGQVYSVDLRHESGQVVFHSESFTGFDDFGTAHLLLPHQLLRPGAYRLIITGPTAGNPDGRQEYDFSISDH